MRFSVWPIYFALVLFWISQRTAFASGECGVVNDVEIPCWTDYRDSSEGDESLPLYPYAKRPNGCSYPFFRPGEYDAFSIFGYGFNFRDACNAHDICYYTNGSVAENCNATFFQSLSSACQDGVSGDLSLEDALTGGTLRISAKAKCDELVLGIVGAVEAMAHSVHFAAQSNQQQYLARAASVVENAKMTYIYLCNETKKDLVMALAYYNGTSWAVRGAFMRLGRFIPNCEILQFPGYRGDVYVLAKTLDGTVSYDEPGGYSFCVSPTSWRYGREDILNADTKDCSAFGWERWKSSNVFHVGPGQNTYTFIPQNR